MEKNEFHNRFYRMHAVILKKRDQKLDLPATIEAQNHSLRNGLDFE